MIDVAALVAQIPSVERFPSVEEIARFSEDLAGCHRFAVTVAGVSTAGRPIHHIRVGQGRTKALFVGGPHAHEPIGSLSAMSLLQLLKEEAPQLETLDVEWHVIPCIDPDGAALNEGWTQYPFSFERYVKNFYLQAYADQVDWSFPIVHKNLQWEKLSREAAVLKAVIDSVDPDYYQALHNTRTGGAFFYVGNDLGNAVYERFYAFLKEVDFPLQTSPIGGAMLTEYAPGVVEMYTARRQYDYLESSGSEAEKLIPHGASSWEYVASRNPDATTFVAELGYARHPIEESDRATGRNLRKTRLRIDADSKYLASVLLDVWDEVKDELDAAHPIYRAIVRGGAVLPERETLLEGGMPVSVYSTREMLTRPDDDREMTEAELFDACIVSGGYIFLRSSYPIVRLLKESPQTPRVSRALQHVEPLFDAALGELDGLVGFDALEPFACDKLAAVQLGTGLIALAARIEREGKTRTVSAA